MSCVEIRSMYYRYYGNKVHSNNGKNENIHAINTVFGFFNNGFFFQKYIYYRFLDVVKFSKQPGNYLANKRRSDFSKFFFFSFYLVIWEQISYDPSKMFENSTHKVHRKL